MGCLMLRGLICAVLAFVTPSAGAADWPMFGRDDTRNAVSPEKDPPLDWEILLPDNVESAERNVKWKAKLGSTTFGSPIVSGGIVWVCSNNEGRRDPAFVKDASCLLAFDERDGSFLWQHLTPRHPGGRAHDWPLSSVASPPLVEGHRLWFITNRWEVVCLDIDPLLRRTGTPRELWKLDLQKDLGVFGRSPSMSFNLRCAIASRDGLIYLTTGNGVDDTYKNVPAPDAPGLVCLKKDTGKLVWSDNSSGKRIRETECASPLVVDVNGRVQVIVPQADGWMRAFDAKTGELIWWFHLNPKAFVPHNRNTVMAAPVWHEGRVYVATGQNATNGEGPGVLWCINPTKTGDVSEELDDGPLPDQTERTRGARRGKPNPNSAVVWSYKSHGLPDKRGRLKRAQRMGRAMGSVTAADGLVVAADYDGYVRCLDARTGEFLWVHDLEAQTYASPLVCDGKVFVTDEDGDVHILALAREPRQLAVREFGQSITTSPVYANGALYIATHDTLYAIGQERPVDPPGAAAAPAEAAAKKWDGKWPQWRGPGRTNISTDTGLMREWPEGGPPLLWKAEGLGEGVPSVAVAAGRVYTLGYRDGGEFLTAWDAASGAKLWACRTGPAVEEMQSMRWLSQRTPTVDGDRVYTVSARGVLACVGIPDGVVRWRKDYAADFGGKAASWGYCDYPLVDGDRLICTPGGKDAAVVALDKTTGELLWKCALPDVDRSTYSAAVRANIGGVPQYVQQFHHGVVGIGVDGRPLWHYAGIDARMGNVHTAIPRGDEVFCSGGWNAGGTLLKLTRDGAQFSAEPRYAATNGRAFEAWLGNSSWIGDHVYTNAAFCLNATTGKLAWHDRIGSRITMVVADERLYYRLEDGTIVMAEVNPKEFVRRGEFQPPRAKTHEPAWSSPVIAGGRLYLRDRDQLLCYDLRGDRTHPFPALPPDRVAATALRPAPVADDDEPDRRPGRDAIFVPTPQDVVERMLEVAKVAKDDVVYDLGCGDGRIVVTAAAKYGCKAVGYDTDPECVRLSERNVRERSVSELVMIERKDVFEVDLSGASVVTLYMGHDVNRRLVPQLEKLKPGARIVSHMFDIKGWEPDETVEMVSSEDDTKHVIYLWTMPLTKR